MYFVLFEPDRSKSIFGSTKESTKEDNQWAGGEEGRMEEEDLNSTIAHGRK